MPIEVFNVRFGFATNSSSTHSLVFLPDRSERTDRDIRSGDYAWSFGWDYWTAASKTAKTMYLAIQLYNNLLRSVPREVAQLIAETWLGEIPTEHDHIDYNSIIRLPRDHGSPHDFPSKRFVEHLKRYFLNPRCVLIGGNDNTSKQHILAKHGAYRVVDLSFRTNSQPVVCRYDEMYDYWTLFNQDTGDKIRLRLSRTSLPRVYDITRSSTPELVDIKITDFCNSGCAFCYANSCPEGAHATNLFLLPSALSALQVLEVSLGGGDPTSFPHFYDLLKEFRKNGIIPNFTVSHLDWLDRNPAIIEECGAFALTARSPFGVTQLKQRLDFYKIRYEKAAIQIPLGTIQIDELDRILTANDGDFRVTLLGFKPVGRGASYTPYDYSSWLSVVENHKNTKVGIDTALASQYRDELAAKNVPNILYDTAEGKFSCYIDAVNQFVAPSSYCDPNQNIPIQLHDTQLSDKIREAFQSF